MFRCRICIVSHTDTTLIHMITFFKFMGINMPVSMSYLVSVSEYVIYNFSPFEFEFGIFTLLTLSLNHVTLANVSP